MINVEARGYANKPENKTTKNGKSYSTFTLSVKQKERGFGGAPDTVTRAFYNVTDWNNSSAPAEGAYVTVKGFMKVRSYEKDGQKRQALDITAQELTIAPPLDKGDGQSPETPAAPEKDPWED